MSDNKPGSKSPLTDWLGPVMKTWPVWMKVVLIAIAFGVLMMTAPDLFGFTKTESPRPKGATEVSAAVPIAQDELARLEQVKEAELEQVLAGIAGAGRVTVKVSLKSGPTITPVTDFKKQTTTTKEHGGNNDSRETTTTDEDVTTVLAKDGAGAVAVMKQSRPEIAGVLIVAEGARNQTIKNRLFQAARTALGIAPELIQVESAERR